MTEPVTLHIYGTPVPQGSKTAFVRGDRAILTDGRRKGARESHAAWRQAVATAARDWLTDHDGRLPFDQRHALCLTVVFRLAKPKGKPKYQHWIRVRPDLSKLVRAVEDALADGGLVTDDARIARIQATKLYAAGRQPGADIVIQPLNDALAEL